jgi:hypothetical protein
MNSEHLITPESKEACKGNPVSFFEETEKSILKLIWKNKRP